MSNFNRNTCECVATGNLIEKQGCIIEIGLSMISTLSVGIFLFLVVTSLHTPLFKRLMIFPFVPHNFV